MLIILATQEAEFRRIAVQGSLIKKLLRSLQQIGWTRWSSSGILATQEL
jgi:hypothetical protein